MVKRREDQILEDITQYFGFLFDKGYKIRDVQHFQEAFGNWCVILESSKHLIRIDSDRNYISVSFDPEKENSKNQLDLGLLIYYLSNEKHFVGHFEGNPAWGKKKQLEKISGLLNEHHAQIASLLERDYQKLGKDLTPSQKAYSELPTKRYSKKFSAENKIWKGLNLFALLFKLIGFVFLAYLGWGATTMFITETNISAKIMYGSITAAIVAILVILGLRFLKNLFYK